MRIDDRREDEYGVLRAGRITFIFFFIIGVHLLVKGEIDFENGALRGIEAAHPEGLRTGFSEGIHDMQRRLAQIEQSVEDKIRITRSDPSMSDEFKQGQDQALYILSKQLGLALYLKPACDLIDSALTELKKNQGDEKRIAELSQQFNGSCSLDAFIEHHFQAMLTKSEFKFARFPKRTVQRIVDERSILWAWTFAFGPSLILAVLIVVPSFYFLKKQQKNHELVHVIGFDENKGPLTNPVFNQLINNLNDEKFFSSLLLSDTDKAFLKRYECPFLLAYTQKPVALPGDLTGQFFDRDQLCQHLQTKQTDPLTGVLLPSTNRILLTRNLTAEKDLISLIEARIEAGKKQNEEKQLTPDVDQPAARRRFKQKPKVLTSKATVFTPSVAQKASVAKVQLKGPGKQ